jgi:hypothetical protein
VAHLKTLAATGDPKGYYAGRVLCDILPVVSLLSGLDSAAASMELQQARKTDSGIVFCI